MENLLENLNPEQRRAVECTDGPVLIVAGAGSGKTRVLTTKVAYLIEKGADPSAILALTFTKKAAGEMKDRIASFVGDRKARRIWMGTFHSVFVRFLREFSDRIGYPPEFTIYDQTDSVSAVKACIKQLGLDEKIYKPREVLSRISRAKNGLVTAASYNGEAGARYREEDRRARKPEIARIFLRYQETLKAAGVMDFDDILLNMCILMKYHEDAANAISGRFRYIFVDEYQDTNAAQYQILRYLAKPHGNICVVGDDSQSIYAFRGAEIENILRFSRDFPGTRIFRLVSNYRSTRVIVGASNSVIARNEGRIPKQCVAVGPEGEKIRLERCFTEQEEALRIADSILDRLHSDKCTYSDFAILYRTNSQSRAIEEALRKRNLPYIIFSGNSFFERQEVRDVMAYLRLAVNRGDDEAFRRAVGKPPRGIGDTSVNALAQAAQVGGCSLFQAAYLEGLDRYGLRPSAVVKIRAFCEMIVSAAGDVSSADAYDVATRLADASGIYLFYKGDSSIEGMGRTANVEELMSSIASYVEERKASQRADILAESEIEDESLIPDSALSPVTLGEYLENTSLLSAVDVDDEDSSNKVVMMTIHSSKGLEFPYVFVAGMEENIFPSGGFLLPEKDVEEERRLFYVAVTRAKKAVTLTFTTSRMRNGKRENNPYSRFLREIDPSFIENPRLIQGRGMLPDFDTFDDGASFGRRQGGFSWSSRPEPSRSERWSSRPSAPSRSTAPAVPRTAEQVRSRPLPPKTEDPSFVADSPDKFFAGARIEHNRFGMGTILEITGDYPESKARVKFDAYGEKILLLKYAKMRLR